MSLDQLLDRDIDLVKELAATNSGTMNKAGVDSVGRRISGAFEQLGLVCTRYHHKMLGDLLYLRSSKKDTATKRVLISGHLDTVFEPESGFTEVSETASSLYGPGVNDMKSGLVIALRALRMLRDKYGELANVGVLLSPDEEVGSKAHRKRMLQIAKNYHIGLVLEGVGNDWQLCDQRKGVAEIYIETYGEAGHSGHWGNRRINAIDTLARLITEVVSLADLERGTTINAGIVQGGGKINIVADHAFACFDVRYTQHDELDRVKRALTGLAELFAAECRLTPLFPPMTPTQKTQELTQAVIRAGQRIGR
jgi:glutamate carboxypeptidase